MTALGATCGQNEATILGGHARAEPVAALTNEVRRLKCALHRGLHQDVPKPLLDSRAGNSEVRSLRAGGAQVNAGFVVLSQILQLK